MMKWVCKKCGKIRGLNARGSEDAKGFAIRFCCGISQEIGLSDKYNAREAIHRLRQEIKKHQAEALGLADAIRLLQDMFMFF